MSISPSSMSVTPPISGFFGLDPRFLTSPAANSSLMNSLLYGAAYEMVPINFGGFYTGIPPVFGGQGFNGFQTVPYNMFSQPSVLMSPFSGGGAFGTGYGTQGFGSNPMMNGGFNNQPVNPFASGYGTQNPYAGYGAQNPYASYGTQNPYGAILGGGYGTNPYGSYGVQQQNPFASALGGYGASPYGVQSPFGYSSFF